MSEIELLNAATHAELGLADEAGRTHWHGFVELMLGELVEAATHYPLFFAKDAETGRFAIGMLHGIRSGEPIRAAEGRISSAYVPAALKRLGFFAVGENIGIERSDPRFVAGSGRRLFESDGRPTPALREVQQAIGTLKTGREATGTFIQALLQHKLIEAVEIGLDFDDGEKLNLDGLYTISLDRLNALPDAAVLELFRKDYMRLAFCVVGSLAQIAVLARDRNRALAL